MIFLAKETKKSEYKRLGVKLFKDKDADILEYLRSQTLNQSIIVRLGIRTLQSMYGETDLLEVIAKGNLARQNAVNYKKISKPKGEDSDKTGITNNTSSAEEVPKEVQKKTVINESHQVKNKKPKRLPQADLELWDDQNFDNL